MVPGTKSKTCRFVALESAVWDLKFMSNVIIILTFRWGQIHKYLSVASNYKPSINRYLFNTKSGVKEADRRVGRDEGGE